MTKMTHFFAIFILAAFSLGLSNCQTVKRGLDERNYNGPYSGPFLNRVAFPIGGIGAGMFCLEGTGAISHVSVRNTLHFFNEPCTFAAITIKEDMNVARVLEGPVPN